MKWGFGNYRDSAWYVSNVTSSSVPDYLQHFLEHEKVVLDIS